MDKRKLSSSINVDTFEIDTRDKLILEYYVIENELDFCETYSKIYGIEIIKKKMHGEDSIVEESSRIEDLSVYPQKIENLADKLACLSVTPISLYDVLENVISSSSWYDDVLV